MTGFGLYMGMKACARAAWGSDSLNGKTVAMQGFGKVAFNTAHHLLKEDARLVVTDVYPGALDRARELGIKVVGTDAIYDADCDIFSPCALGGVLNSDTIPRLKCRVVAGGANNQLLTDADGEELDRRGIVYAPDYIVNSGGIINVEAELGGHYSPSGHGRKRSEFTKSPGVSSTWPGARKYPLTGPPTGWLKSVWPRYAGSSRCTGCGSPERCHG